MAGFANRLLNADFRTNSGAVSGTVVLLAGQFGHDGYRGGSGGCTYTFARANGVTTLTILAGTLVQTIAGALLPEVGPYNLSWLGTAPGRINGGAYGPSSVQATSLPADTDATIEWGAGTLALPMFERGSRRTEFEYRGGALFDLVPFAQDESSRAALRLLLKRIREALPTSPDGLAPGEPWLSGDSIAFVPQT